jgi:hypothetical protein
MSLSRSSQRPARLVRGRRAKLAPLARAPAGVPAGCLPPFCSERLDGRLAAALGSAPYAEAWSAPLAQAARGSAWVLASGRDAIVLGPGAWQRFTDGTPSFVGVRTGKDAEWLPGDEVLLHSDRSARLVAEPSTPAAPGWSAALRGVHAGASASGFGYVHRTGDRIVVEHCSDSGDPHLSPQALDDARIGYL